MSRARDSVHFFQHIVLMIFDAIKGRYTSIFFGGEVAKGGRLTPSSRAIFVSMLQFKETNDGFNGDTVDGRNLAPY